jgi:signal transduction histidine kinase
MSFQPLRPTAPRLVVAILSLTIGLAVVGWFDYRATRQDLLDLLVEQAVSLRQAVAAAARSAGAAAAQAQSALAARLLDNARLMDRLDQRGALTAETLDTIAREHRLFRITVLGPTGAREMSAGVGGPPAGAGRGFGPGPGGGGGGGGLGLGPGGGGAGGGLGSALAEQLMKGAEREAVSEVHGSRWGRGWRLTAGIKRTGGGAIILNVDAQALAELGQQASIEHLLDDIAAGSPEVAYVVLVDGDTRSAHGPLAQSAVAAAPEPGTPPAVVLTDETAGLTVYEREVGGRSVLEFVGPVDTSVPSGAVLRLGLSLDGLRGAERRSLTRLAVSLLSALGLGVLALAFVGLRREHGSLREQHALAQEALRRKDRLAAMGELASTVAHEVRNPLNAIGMSVQRLRKEFLDAAPTGNPEDLAEQRDLLDVLGSETQRIDRIVQQFLEYARPPRLVPRRVDLSALLTSLASSVTAMAAARGVSVTTDVDGAGEAVLDGDQFRQAVGNLIRNAIDASPAGGAVTVRASRGSGGHVVVVEDHGIGIAADHLPRIFDLYFTTKADGTGVGLAVTHQIIEAHGGSIEVDTAPGRGTRMIVHLPLSPEPHTRA